MNDRHLIRSGLHCSWVMLAAVLISQTVAAAQSTANHPNRAPSTPSISITVVPPAVHGGPDKTYPISGRIDGVTPASYKVVVYTLAGGTWWVQPTVAEPLTDINGNGGWATDTHGGASYAALLVKATYGPPPNAVTLPKLGGDVVAVTREAGR